MSRIDVKLPFAMTGPKTTAGKGVLQLRKVVADFLRLVAELWTPGGPCGHFPRIDALQAL
jgi:hypothetical protein